MEKEFTHFNSKGKAKMVDVSSKKKSNREAIAYGKVLVNKKTFDLIKTGGMKKGDVLTVAQIAGIMGAKKTAELIPMAHPIMIDGVDLEFNLNEKELAVEVKSYVTIKEKTGVEMEALTAVSTACLTIYDMCKAIQKDIVITDIKLLSKKGGTHGDYKRK